MQKKDIIKIKFNFYAFHSQALSNILTKIIKKVKVMQIKTSGPVFLPTKIQRFTVLRSPHVNKKSREQFELKIHKRLFIVYFPLNNNFHKQNAKYLIKYIKSLCGETQVKITYMPGKI